MVEALSLGGWSVVDGFGLRIVDVPVGVFSLPPLFVSIGEHELASDGSLDQLMGGRLV